MSVKSDLGSFHAATRSQCTRVPAIRERICMVPAVAPISGPDAFGQGGTPGEGSPYLRTAHVGRVHGSADHAFQCARRVLLVQGGAGVASRA